MDVKRKLVWILEEPCGGLYPACELADYLLDQGVTVQDDLDEYNRKKENDAPVLHGRWGVDGVYVVCSVCNGFTLSPIVKQLPTFKYCPNCGAKMDLE